MYIYGWGGGEWGGDWGNDGRDGGELGGNACRKEGFADVAEGRVISNIRIPADGRHLILKNHN